MSVKWYQASVSPRRSGWPSSRTPAARAIWTGRRGSGTTPFLTPHGFAHECVAEVMYIGAEVAAIRPGSVWLSFQISCGECFFCRSGRTGDCQAVPPISMYGLGVIGWHWGGAVADGLAVPFADGMLVPLSDRIEPAAAASVADNVSGGYRHIAPQTFGADRRRSRGPRDRHRIQTAGSSSGRIRRPTCSRSSC